MKYKEVLRDLPLLLPGTLARRLSLDTVKIEPGSYIDEQLASGYSDLLFSCQFAGRRGFLYFLFEHQSKPERDMPLRMADYTLQITKDWRKRNHGAKTLPIVVPVVLYQSKRRWTGPTQYSELLEVDSDLKKELGHVLLSCGFILIALEDLDIEKIQCGMLLQLSLGLMKAVAQGNQTRWLQRNAERLGEILSVTTGLSALRLMLTYYYQTEKGANSASTVKRIANRLTHQTVRNEVMSLAEALQEQGRKEGHNQGHAEGRAEGLLVGKIQMCQRLLGKKEQSAEQLTSRSRTELESALALLQKEIERRWIVQP